MASSSSSSSSRIGHSQQQQQLQRASSAPVAGAEAAGTSGNAKSNVKLSVTNKALTTSAKRSDFSHLIPFLILHTIGGATPKFLGGPYPSLHLPSPLPLTFPSSRYSPSLPFFSLPLEVVPLAYVSYRVWRSPSENQFGAL